MQVKSFEIDLSFLCLLCLFAAIHFPELTIRLTAQVSDVASILHESSRKLRR
jgi:hypothetical protein